MIAILRPLVNRGPIYDAFDVNLFLSSSQIALQFPDELLHDSVPIYRALKARIGEGQDLYVLADTSYGR